MRAYDQMKQDERDQLFEVLDLSTDPSAQITHQNVQALVLSYPHHGRKLVTGKPLPTKIEIEKIFKVPSR